MCLKEIEEKAAQFATYYRIFERTSICFPERKKRRWLALNAPKYLLCRIIMEIGMARIIDIVVAVIVIASLSAALLYFCDKAYSFEYLNDALMKREAAMSARMDSLENANDSLTAMVSTARMHEWVWEGFANRKKYAAPTSEMVMNIAKDCGSEHPAVVAKVVRLESDNGRTAVAKRTNNVTGMGKSTSRKSVRTKKFDTEKTYSEYEHWIHSVVDFILWEKGYDTTGLTDDEYCDFLQEKYNRNETKDYAKRLKAIRIG